MNCIVKWVSAILSLAMSASFATAQMPTQKAPVYIKVVGKVAANIPLIELGKLATDLADEATRRDSKVVAQAIERGFRDKTQLVAGTVSGDLVVEQTRSFWRGSVTQKLTMPCTATLAIDLDHLLKNSTFNPARKTIEVYLPPLSIIAVESHNARYTTDPEYAEGCWEWYDSGTAKEMEVSLLKSDWGAIAREKMEPNAQLLRTLAKHQTTRFLRGLLEPVNPELTIVVHP